MTRFPESDGAAGQGNFLGVKLAGVPVPEPVRRPVTGDLSLSAGEETPLNTSRGEKTRINYRLTAPGRVSIKVYDQKGDVVWQDSLESEGTEGSVEWEGRTKDNRLLPPGRYIIHFQAPGINTTRSISISR